MSPSYQTLSHFRHCWPNKKPCSQGATTTYLRRSEARRSIEQSLARLGLERVPLLYLHDPEKNAFADMVPGGPIDVLLELRESGVAGAVGVAGGDVAAMTRYLELDVFDVLLTHNRWSLVNRNADALIDQAAPPMRLWCDNSPAAVSYTHLRAHETDSYLVCRL